MKWLKLNQTLSEIEEIKLKMTENHEVISTTETKYCGNKILRV